MGALVVQQHLATTLLDEAEYRAANEGRRTWVGQT